MTPAEVCRAIAADCETDALALDGQPFDGRHIATQFGNTLAMLSALAKVTAELLDHYDKAAP